MDARGLPAYLRQKAASMRAAAEGRSTGEEWHETVEAVCVADDATGVRKLRIRDWQFVSDSGPGFGGWSLGPSSPELLCGVVSTCLTHTYLIGAATLGIAVERLEVRVSAENNDAAFLGIATDDPPLPFNITAHVNVIASETVPQDIARLHDFAATNCPLTRLVRAANPITIVTG